MEKRNKKFSDYQQTLPMQLDLFRLPDDQNYSQTIELYDFVPKYVPGKVEPQRVDGRYLEPITRDFECRGKPYQLTLIPARIQTEAEGIYKDYFLGVREEIVEDALRKIAIEGKGIMLDGELGMSFSIYQVEQEVKKSGHTYSYRQIVDALNILATATIRISTKSEVETTDQKKGKTAKGKDLVFHPLETLVFDNEVEGTPTFLRFSPLVAKSIRESSYRMLNYRESMKLKSFIARQLYKRMSHHFIQASLTSPYAIKLTTIISDFGLTKQSRLKNNLANVEESLEEMKANDDILAYKSEKIFDVKRKNKLSDVLFRITPHPRFIADAKKFNAKAADNRTRMARQLPGE